MSDELKACPFCGGKAELRGITVTEIRCTNDQCISSGAFNNYGHREDAIAAWNRRPAPAVEPVGMETVWQYRYRYNSPGAIWSRWGPQDLAYDGHEGWQKETRALVPASSERERKLREALIFARAQIPNSRYATYYIYERIDAALSSPALDMRKEQKP